MNLATLAKCRCICKQRDKLLMLLAVFLCTVAAAENDMTASTDKLRVLKNLYKPQNSWCMDYFNHLTPMEVYSYGQKRTW